MLDQQLTDIIKMLDPDYRMYGDMAFFSHKGHIITLTQRKTEKLYNCTCGKEEVIEAWTSCTRGKVDLHKCSCLGLTKPIIVR